MNNKIDLFCKVDSKVNTLKTLINRFNEAPDQIKISDKEFLELITEWTLALSNELNIVQERLKGKKNTIETIEKECQVSTEELRQAGEFLSQLPIEDDRVEVATAPRWDGPPIASQEPSFAVRTPRVDGRDV